LLEATSLEVPAESIKTVAGV